MNKRSFIAGGCLLILSFFPFSSGYADFGSIFKKVQETIGGSSGVSQNEIVDGLKEALEIGTDKTVMALSQVNGYYGNPQLKIPLPQSFQKFEKILRATGFASELDAFDLSMNRAAEKAAPEAKTLFVDAIKEMTFSDADKILKGGDNEATTYFKNKTSGKLQTLFKPIIEQSMESVGVTRSYQSLSEKIQSIPFAGDYAVDLDDYVTEKSIDGLFIRLAEEEAKIRNDPAARVTDLLKKVFQ
ncbi:DUF4197 domain-containing protein [Desulfosarcina sp.]|uniref:DUF4197 domain-containing protein n=1 Tax=Desulfosarcina sp. TaxID=2027861 RepID=UPI0029BD180B|nr:DUF4197 domain-containing protein [Desulfosarcina sp.]MDX2455449.1 DUF4197 domain-containing protein [Desulfosarcina sp.]MDX2492943.1 DUF4197 domain-containing protein [Desulfosarcina sp.]